MAQPLPGDTEPGDLYVDAGSRQIWLGMDEAVEPSGSILIADIAALVAADAVNLAEAKAYTDTGVATRAPTVHTHTASQITDFEAAVTAVVGADATFNWVRGMVMMWSGALSAIGVGSLAGWALCDGTTYNVSGVPVTTPDLRDRFIVGAGNKTPGSTNPGTALTTSQDPGHKHTIDGAALSVAQLPAHQHYGEIHSRQYGATYGGAGAHQHGIHLWSNSNDAGGHVRQEGTADAGVAAATEVAGAHDHNCYVDIHVGMTTDYRGSGQTHTHTEQTGGAHSHTVTPAVLREGMPYYALAFIMKL
jgi:hypothetical protein